MQQGNSRSNVHLYALTLAPAAHCSAVVVGNFSGGRGVQEIIAARAGRLDVLRVDAAGGKLRLTTSEGVFGVVRALAAVRLTGATRDHLVVTSDSGRVAILSLDAEKCVFVRVHLETFGRGGCRRIVPGQFLAADPQGRAVMLAAVEKHRLVYVLNRDAQANLTISSPLEAHRPRALTLALAALDVGFDNPLFAAIELEYPLEDDDDDITLQDTPEKLLVLYELDLGLNHVVRKSSAPIHPRSNHLIAIPGGSDGPSGVLVCSENYITWCHHLADSLRIPIPRRLDPLSKRPTLDSDQNVTSIGKNIIVVASVVHKLKTGFFVLMQTEEGDLFKLTMDFAPVDGDLRVSDIRIKYFDTLPVAAGLILLKAGFLFCASEFGNAGLYQIDNLGDDDEDQPEYTAADFPQSNDYKDLPDIVVYFKPRPLRNLTLVDDIQNLSPIIDSKVLNLTDEDSPQIYTICGRGARSTFRTLRHGTEVNEVAVSELPGNPSAVWTVKSSSRELFDSYIVVSFVNATLVLSIGDTVEEVTDSGFLTTTPTLAVSQLGDDALVQVYPTGIRHIRSDRRVSEWKTPGNRRIEKAICNERQVAISLSGGELVYFELDTLGQLTEHQERKQMPSNVTALALGTVKEGRARSKFLAIGCSDSTVRVLSLDPDTCLDPVSMQALNSTPSSLLILNMNDPNAPGVSTTYLNIGLENGVLLRTVLDDVTGTLSDTRVRFLGGRPVKLFRISILGNEAFLGLSSRPWIGYSDTGRVRVVPLSYEALEWGSSFSSEPCPEGVVSVSGNTLRIFTIEKLDTTFHQAIVPLKFTPRKFALHPYWRNFIVVESDYNTWCPSDAKRMIKEANEVFEMDEPLEALDPSIYNLPRAEPGKWGSCIRLINPFTNQSTCVIDLDDNEAAFSVAIVGFDSYPNELFAVVGTGKDLNLSPTPSATIPAPQGSLHVYRYNEDGTQLVFVHKTDIDGTPYAMCSHRGKLLVGAGKFLRFYDMGRKRLLRKCESKPLPNCIVRLETIGDRILIGDVQESILFATYKSKDNKLLIYCDDTATRWTTAMAVVDYNTCAGGDKFGNFFVNRIPSEVTEEVEEDPTGNRLVFERGSLNGCLHKVEHVAEFYVGETITSLQKVVLVAGGREILLYTTLLGSIGTMIPFISKTDVEFFQDLEAQLRKSVPPLVGRDHLSYRSSYVPVKNVVDGDFCELFNLLAYEVRKEIAGRLERSPQEVAKKLEDMRNRVAF